MRGRGELNDDGFKQAAGQTLTNGSFVCTAPTDEQTTADGRVKYTVTGWKLTMHRPAGDEITTGSGTECPVMIGADEVAEVEWQLSPQYKGSVSAASGCRFRPEKVVFR